MGEWGGDQVNMLVAKTQQRSDVCKHSRLPNSYQHIMEHILAELQHIQTITFTALLE